MKFENMEIRETVSQESNVPLEITKRLLEGHNFEKLPETTSALIEDFFIDSLNQNLSYKEIIEESEKIKRVFFERMSEIHEVNKGVFWDDIFNKKIEISLKINLVQIAKDLGFEEFVLKEIKDINFELTDSVGVSHAGESANVASLQIIRKAMDYIKIFPESDFNEVVQTLVLTTFAHEAGHVIDKLLKNYSNHIPEDLRWKGGDNRMERFAEFFAREVSLPEIKHGIRDNEKLIHVKKAQEVWEALGSYKEKNPNIGIHQLFKIFRKSEDDKNLKSFVEARETLYGAVTPEIYASPYTRDDLRKDWRG